MTSRDVTGAKAKWTYLPESLFTFIVSFSFLGTYVGQKRLFAMAPGSDWMTSEWMINYADGFIRRGLGGVMIGGLMRVTHLSFFPIWFFLTWVVYFVLCGYFLSISLRSRAPWIWRFALLLNPLLLIFAIEANEVSRKDELFVLAMLATGLLVRAVLRKQSAGERFPARACLMALLLIALMAGLLSLLQEGMFLFTWLPLSFLITAFMLKRLHLRRLALIPLLGLTFLPSLVILFLSTTHHGDKAAAQVICQSWQSRGIAVVCSSGQMPPAFAALGWTFKYALSLSLITLPKFPYYLVIYAVMSVVAAATTKVFVPESRTRDLLATQTIVFLAALPLFVLGLDWGRWICSVAIAAQIILFHHELQPAATEFIPSRVSKRFEHTLRSGRDVIAATRHFAERHPVFFCSALFFLPVPLLPIPGRLLWENPLWILAHYVRQYRP